MIRIFNNTDLSYEDLGYFIDKVKNIDIVKFKGITNKYIFEIRGKKYLIKTKRLMRDFKVEVSDYGRH